MPYVLWINLNFGYLGETFEETVGLVRGAGLSPLGFGATPQIALYIFVDCCGFMPQIENF